MNKIKFKGIEHYIPNADGPLSVFDSARIDVLLTSTQFQPQTIACYVDGETLDKYMDEYQDPDGVYSGIAVALEQNCKLPYGVLIPIQFNGSEQPALLLDDLAKEPRVIHPLIEARIKEVREASREKNKQDILNSAKLRTSVANELKGEGK